MFVPCDELLKQLSQVNAQAQAAQQQKIQTPAKPPQKTVVNMPGVS